MQEAHQNMARPSPWAEPVRLSGIAALFFLLGPGTFHGFLHLLAYAGYDSNLVQVKSSVHALLQLIGFFYLVIWGFLTNSHAKGHAKRPWLRDLRIPMALTAGGLLLVWLQAGWSMGHVHAGYALLTLGVFGGTALSVLATFRTKPTWRARPFPLLLAGLWVPPFAAILAWADALGANLGKLSGDLLLFGGIVPIILAMGYRMFASLTGFRHPHDRIFDLASVIWLAGVALRSSHIVGLAGPLWLPSAMLMLAALLFVISLRAFEPIRPNPIPREPELADHAVTWHVRAGLGFLLAATLLDLTGEVSIWTSPYFVTDAARHLLAIGFALLTVMGLTQRMYPTLLRGKRSSGPWMVVNGSLVGSGLLLRTSIVFLPESGPFVAAGGVLLVTGILGFGLQLLRAMLIAAPSVLAPLQPIRKPGEPQGQTTGVEPPS
jgi:hypothetical protein